MMGATVSNRCQESTDWDGVALDHQYEPRMIQCELAAGHTGHCYCKVKIDDVPIQSVSWIGRELSRTWDEVRADMIVLRNEYLAKGETLKVATIECWGNLE